MKANIIAMIEVRGRGAYLDLCLSHLKEYAAGAVILFHGRVHPNAKKVLKDPVFDGFIKETAEIAKRKGSNPDQIKLHLLNMAKKQDPDWIISLDADEIFEERMKQEMQALVENAAPDIDGYSFRPYYLWDSENQYRIDSGFFGTKKIKLFKNVWKSGNIKQSGLQNISESDIRIKNFTFMKLNDRKTMTGFKGKDSSMLLRHLLDENIRLKCWKEDRRSPTVSLCMIVKNETQDLEKCLNSVKSAYNELIVAWSGTNPQTKKILKDHGAIIIPYKWKNNYADARNKSIEKATKDWIFILDADEYIEDGKVAQIRKMLTDTDETAFYTRIKSFSSRNNNEFIVGGVLRIFRNNLGIRFRYRTHEDAVLPKHHECALSTLEILHTGYLDIASTNKKIKHRISLLKKEVKLCLSNPWPHFLLGREYARIHDWEKAIIFLDKYLVLSEKYNTPQDHALVYLAYCYTCSNDHDKAVKTGYKALLIDNLLLDPYIFIAIGYNNTGYIANAEFTLMCALQLLHNQIFNTVGCYSIEEYKTIPRFLLAQIYAENKKPDLAKKLLDEIFAIKPDDEKAKELLERLERKS